MFQAMKDYANALRGIFRIMADPGQTDAIFEIGKGIDRSGILAKQAKAARAKDPEVDRLIGDRYSPPVPKLEELIQLPEGTLGRVFAENMTRNGFVVEFYPKTEVVDDGSYFLLRLRRTHDIWHTVTGFGTDPVGELGLQAFMFAQLKSPLSVVLIGIALVRMLFRPVERRAILAEVRRGYRLGKEARPLLPKRFEDGWSRPLREWRKELQLAV